MTRRGILGANCGRRLLLIVAGLVGAQCALGAVGYAHPDVAFDLARARAQHQPSIQVLILARHGENARLNSLLKKRGADIRFRDDSIDYIRAQVRTSDFTEIMRFPEVVVMSIDRSYIERAGPQRVDNTTMIRQDSGWPPRASEEPLVHFVSPLEGLNAVHWRQVYPAFDGRGVMIGHMEEMPDFLSPELQTALTLDGKAIPKFAGVINTVDPVTGHDAEWVDMRHRVSANRELTVTFAGRIFKLPRAGDFQIGILDESQFLFMNRLDFQHDPPAGKDSIFGVLWDPRSGEVWVDVERTHDFGQNRPLFDFSVRGDVGIVGHADPAFFDRGTLGYTLQVDAKHQFIAINIGDDGHATMDAGSMAGSRGRHGRIEGVAPGAQLLAFYSDLHSQSSIESVIRAIEDPRVDLFCCDTGENGISGPVQTGVIDRLIARYDKPAIGGSGDGTVTGRLFHQSTVAGAFTIGGYESAASYRENAGMILSGTDHLHFASPAYGPSVSGALKPDVIAPSGYVVPGVGAYQEFGREGLFQLPAGYFVGSGASQAAPTAAGAIALLMSAAKQEHVRYSAASIQAALNFGARYLPTYASYKQGNGVVDVERSWEVLKTWNGTVPPIIDIVAPLAVKDGRQATDATTGSGLYEREGWTLGMRAERVITLLRRTGPAEDVSYAAHWIGNDGTFSGSGTVTLPLGKPVRYAVMVQAATSGAHSAILSLDDASNVPVARISAMIIVPEDLTGPQPSLDRELRMEEPLNQSLFVRIPAGVSALQVTTTGHIRLRVHAPDITRRSIQSDLDGDFQAVTLTDPEEGVWEIAVESNLLNWKHPFDPLAPRPLVDTLVPVHASIVQLEGRMTSSAIELRNSMAEVKAAVLPTALARMHVYHGDIHSAEQHLHEISVPEGTPYLFVDSLVDIGTSDLFVFRCARDDRCDFEGAERRANCRHCRVVVNQPSVGRWVVAINSAHGLEPAQQYDLKVAVGDPSLGMSTSDDWLQERPSRSSWKASIGSWTPHVDDANAGSTEVVWRLVLKDAAGEHDLDYLTRGAR